MVVLLLLYKRKLRRRNYIAQLWNFNFLDLLLVVRRVVVAVAVVAALRVAWEDKGENTNIRQTTINHLVVL